MLSELRWATFGLAFSLIALGLLFLAKKFFEWWTPFSLSEELLEERNTAVGIVFAGYLLGVVAILCGVFVSIPEVVVTWGAMLRILKPMILDALIGMGLLYVAGFLNDHLIFSLVSNFKEIVNRKNLAMGVVMGVTYIGSGLIIAGSIAGHLDLLSIFITFFLGQLSLLVFSWFYGAITRYPYQRAIAREQNLAAGLAYGGKVLAYSLILMKGGTMQMGALVHWDHRLWHFLYYAVLGALFLGAVRWISDHVFLPEVKLCEEIGQEENVNAGLVEGCLALGMGGLLVYCL